MSRERINTIVSFIARCQILFILREIKSIYHVLSLNVKECEKENIATPFSRFVCAKIPGKVNSRNQLHVTLENTKAFFVFPSPVCFGKFSVPFEATFQISRHG